MSRLCFVLLLFSLSALAQTQPPANSIQASGSATVGGITPDQVQLSIGVVTFAKAAQDAASQNATQADAVIAAIQQKIGTNGTVKTIGYSLSPQYAGGTANTPPTINGYTASNTVQVTVTGTANLNLVGPVIDAANQAGANSISGPSYSLQNSDPYQQQALTAAAKQALAHAGAIAAGLGGKPGAVISAQEGSTVTPVVGVMSGGASATPIQTGTVSVSASVTVTVALAQ
jgi:uncharacterized protein YggE